MIIFNCGFSKLLQENLQELSELITKLKLEKRQYIFNIDQINVSRVPLNCALTILNRGPVKIKLTLALYLIQLLNKKTNS